jgi:hypothetical protein
MTRVARVKDAAGVALFEIVVGVFLLGLIFVPVVNMLIASNQATQLAQFRTTGYPLALGQLQTYTSAVVNNPCPPAASGADLSGTGCTSTAVVATTTSSTTSFPTTTSTTVTVGTETYTVYAAGGWCLLKVGSQNWATPSSGGTVSSIQYFVAVKVTWGTSGIHYTGQAVQSAPVTTQSTWTVPTQAAAVSASAGCPVGLS